MHHPNCGRRARRNGGAPILTIAVATLVTAAILGCSPYPIYNTTGPPPTRDRDGEMATQDRSDTERPGMTRSRDLEFVDADEPVVEPAIFTRIVEDYLGTPYRLGGDDIDGIDCSNLVRVIYRDYDGTRLPSSTTRLYRLRHSVAPDGLSIGDLVFFDFDNSGVSHVGVYLGNGRFVHASKSRGVIISSLNDPDYRDRYVGARRVM